jgi:molybdate transport system substrate-binding protein
MIRSSKQRILLGRQHTAQQAALHCLLFTVYCLLVTGCTAPKTEAIRISAAISTREALEQIAAQFHAQTGVSVEANFGPSSDLARQIERGGGADLFLSADESWADYLDGKGLCEMRRDLLTNELVVVVPAQSTLALHNLDELAAQEIHRLALAAPAVPAGRYARQALAHAGVWPRVKDRVIEGGDVRATLTYVTRGEAEAGVVYATDVLGNVKVRTALSIRSEIHSSIRYPLVLIRRETMQPDARRFYEYLCSEEAADAFRKRGFVVISDEEKNSTSHKEHKEHEEHKR